MTRTSPLLPRVLAALSLPPVFLWAVVVSGLATARTILVTACGRPPPPSACLRVPFNLQTEGWVALKACLITLTPGTATLSIDMAHRELLVHVLDASDTQAVLAGLRRGPVRLVYRMAAEDLP